KWVGAQIEEFGDAQFCERLTPDLKPLGALLEKDDLPVANADCEQLAVVAPIEKPLAWRFLLVVLEKRHEVEAVKMDFERPAVGGISLLHFLHEIGFAGRGRKGGNHVLERADVVDHSPGLDDARPTHEERDTPAPFPVRVLLAAEWRRTTVGP